MSTSLDSHKNVDGEFILYYSEEGYPYYYNEVTGESYWAEYTRFSLKWPNNELCNCALQQL